MKIVGFTKTTLLDYPKHLAATIFTYGCNFRCPYCHNRDLVDHPNPTYLNWIEPGFVLDYLLKRRHLLEGVCISGGEPTLQPNLIPFIEKIKALGYKVKLDTNGSNPHVIRTLMDKNLLDYVAMDVKNTKARYHETVGLNQVDLEAIETTIQMLINGPIDHEFRTTVMHEFHTQHDVTAIGHWIETGHHYTLQGYQKSPHQLCDLAYTAPSKDTLIHWAEPIKPLVGRLEIKC